MGWAGLGFHPNPQEIGYELVMFGTSSNLPIYCKSSQNNNMLWLHFFVPVMNCILVG
jgi:hypothetical protein